MADMALWLEGVVCEGKCKAPSHSLLQVGYTPPLHVGRGAKLLEW